MSKYFTKAETIVNSKGGIMLSSSTEYLSAYSKLSVQCNEQHVFEITLSNLNLNRWCPHCSTRKMERYTKELVQTITNKKFIKIRPDWLKNKEGNNLELDMYCEELKLAIEYNGIQHYKFSSYFYKDEASFQKRLDDDKLKAQLCTNNKIDLIVVPYTVKDVKKYIIDELTKRNIELTNLDKEIIVKSELLQKLNEIVAEKNGQIITKCIIDRDDKIKLKCDKNHCWETRASKILSGSWCHKCGLEVDDETKNKISSKLKLFLQSEEGKLNKKLSFEKRSETMLQRKLEKMAGTTHKVCKGTNSCGQEKEIAHFHKRKASSDGYGSMCKDCVSKNKQLYKNKQIDL